MRCPARKLNDWRLCLVASSTFLAHGALAQQASSAQPADTGAAPGAQTEVAGTESAQAPETGEGTPGAPEGEVGAQQVSPGIAVLARWVRTASCRIFIDIPIDEHTRFSPSKSEKNAAWRISIPRFAGAHMSSIGGSATELPAEEAAAGTESAPGAEGGAAAVAEGAPEVSAPPAPVQPQLTWTQRVGLVKADPPAPGPSIEGAAPVSQQPSWTQRVGLVKSPSTSEPASAGVASFSKKKAEEKKD